MECIGFTGDPDEKRTAGGKELTLTANATNILQAAEEGDKIT